MMKIQSLADESENLRVRFAGLNRAEFARKNNLQGGQSMIYQNITGRRPISMEAAKAYAKGFGCSLEDISPRLAKEALEAAQHLSQQASPSIPSSDMENRVDRAAACLRAYKTANDADKEMLVATALEILEATQALPDTSCNKKERLKVALSAAKGMWESRTDIPQDGVEYQRQLRD